MKPQSTTSLFSSLVAINNHRIEGFNAAAEATADSELRSLFVQFAEASLRCRNELIKAAQELQYEISQINEPSIQFFGGWVNSKEHESALHRKQMLQHCLKGDGKVLDQYKQKLVQNLDSLNPEHQFMLRKQHEEIRDNYLRVKSMLGE